MDAGDRIGPGTGPCLLQWRNGIYPSLPPDPGQIPVLARKQTNKKNPLTWLKSQTLGIVPGSHIFYAKTFICLFVCFDSHTGGEK